VDRHRLAVVVENDNLEEPAGPVGTDVEVTVALAHHAEGVADCVLDVLVGNTVLTGVVRDLHPCRLPCVPTSRKLPCVALCADRAIWGRPLCGQPLNVGEAVALRGMNDSVVVKVKPGSRKGPLVEVGPNGELTIYVRERAVDGKANDAVTRLLATHLQLPRSRVELVSGTTSRLKRFRVSR
jgi:uncharacterized protein